MIDSACEKKDHAMTFKFSSPRTPGRKPRGREQYNKPDTVVEDEDEEGEVVDSNRNEVEQAGRQAAGKEKKPSVLDTEKNH